MPLDDEYPRTIRQTAARFRQLLSHDLALYAVQREELCAGDERPGG